MAERLIDDPPADARPLAFIDLEASGLGATSWPVEVGWAFEKGEAHAMLVRPDAAWLASAWEASAEKLHRLSRADLERDGSQVREVCAAMNAALADCDVYSDSPDWDGFWLFRLFGAAGMKQAFAIHDYGRLVRPLAGVREEALLARAARIAPRRHRAAADAMHLRTLYLLARAASRPRLTR